MDSTSASSASSAVGKSGSSQAYRDAVLLEVLFQRGHPCLREVEDRRGQRGVGAAAREDVDEVIEAAGAARGNHRNRDGARDGRRHLAVETGLRAVTID